MILSILALMVVGGVLIFFLRRRWVLYVESRETLYQPLILMAIADEEGGKLGPPFDGGRRIGDWLIVENALFKWSKDLAGFGHKGFCRIFEKNDFGEYERDQLGNLLASRRATAAQRLGHMFYFKAIPNLLPLLKDRSSEVQRMASWALAKIGQADSSGLYVTSSRPMTVREASGESVASIRGRFLWEDGSHIIIGDKEETDYLVHRVGGMHADVRNMPISVGQGREIRGGSWRTYSKEYLLTNVTTLHSATVKAVLKQSVGEYYAVLHQQRENISVQAGSVTENIDFVLPKIKNPDDRISVVGRLIYSDNIEPGYHSASTHGRAKAVVSLRSLESSRYSGYLSYKQLKDYRLHDVPAGRYNIKAVISDWVYEGIVDIPAAQPFTLDLTLSRAKSE